MLTAAHEEPTTCRLPCYSMIYLTFLSRFIAGISCGFLILNQVRVAFNGGAPHKVCKEETVEASYILTRQTASHDIHRLSFNLKVCYGVHNSPSLKQDKTQLFFFKMNFFQCPGALACIFIELSFCTLKTECLRASFRLRL